MLVQKKVSLLLEQTLSCRSENRFWNAGFGTEDFQTFFWRKVQQWHREVVVPRWRLKLPSKNPIGQRSFRKPHKKKVPDREEPQIAACSFLLATFDSAFSLATVCLAQQFHLSTLPVQSPVTSPPAEAAAAYLDCSFFLRYRHCFSHLGQRTVAQAHSNKQATSRVRSPARFVCVLLCAIFFTSCDGFQSLPKLNWFAGCSQVQELFKKHN